MKHNLFIRYFKVCSLSIIFFFLLSFTNVLAQDYTEITTSNGAHVRIDSPNNGVSVVAIEDEKEVTVFHENPEEVVRIIVTFKEQPLAAKKISNQKSSMISAYTALQANHTLFKANLNTTQQLLSNQFNSNYNYTITREYFQSLNGVAMECKRRMMSKIIAMPMVKTVSLDREVKADLTQSVHQIRADIVQDSLGYTGDGVLVGDIDTGIDYNNPLLGGGFGPGFRVVGGYDFVNNDNDPMDDKGHGTHVAGIIGANDGDAFRGVAPEVKFLAVKVLDADGHGYNSDIIAGIDYCLDPDGNPETDDAVDIINMSLGGRPLPDNPLDIAVNNATKAGVLSIVSAGNNGVWGYGTIGSPGTSESALTVGACDSTFNIADFSSSGPDPLNSLIKPEVIAPGVNIISTELNNELIRHSGTSMAAPHVTGVAALLKQIHPSWTPEEIKAAIINSAHSVGEDISVYTQGKGCVDALDAANLGMVIYPGVMNFGMVDLEKDVWQDTVTLGVKNFHSILQNVQINILEGLQEGITLTFNKTSFSLEPGEETTIQAILTVPSSVPVLEEEPFSYLGKIEIKSDSDNVVVPFNFTKASMLVVTFDKQPKSVTLVNITQSKTVNSHTNVSESNNQLTYTVNQGDSYELLAHMEHDTLGVTNAYIVRHIIDDLSGLTYAYVSSDEATISLIDTVYDINNNKVETTDSLSLISLGLSVLYENAVATGGNSSLNLEWNVSYRLRDINQLFISQLDSSFLIRKKISITKETAIFFLSKTTTSLHNKEEIAINSGSENLIEFHIKGSYDDPYLGNSSPATKMKIFGTITSSLKIKSNGFSFLDRYEAVVRSHDINSVYYNKHTVNQEEQSNKHLYSALWIGEGYWPYQNGILRTPDFTIDQNNEANFKQVRIDHLEPWSSKGGEFSTGYIIETLKSGDTIKVEQNAHVNYPDFMTYIRNGSLFMKCNNDWFGKQLYSYGGIKQLNGTYEQRDNMNLYWNMPLFEAQVFSRNRALTNMKPFVPKVFIPSYSYDYNLAFSEYDNMENNAGALHILSDTQPYNILGQKGQCIADFEYQVPDILNDQYLQWSINLLGASVVFPSFNLIQVSVDGKAVDMVEPNQNAIIRLIPFDYDSSVTSAKISLVLASGDEIDLPVKYIGNQEYNASIPNYLPKGFIDIVASIEDVKGNKCKLTASPGFYFGNTEDNIKLDARISLNSYALDNVDDINMQTGDTLNYTLSYTNYGSDVAQNVVLTFPTTPYFKPIGSPSWTADSLAVNDTVQVPVKLIFLGPQNSVEEYTHYTPSITWTSNGTSYLRRHNVFVDFNNTITDIDETLSDVPKKFELYQNYPNPFNPSTNIKFSLPKKTEVELAVYDILGRKVMTLVNEIKKAGSYEVTWNANNFASGVYFYRLIADDFVTTKKLLFLK